MAGVGVPARVPSVSRVSPGGRLLDAKLYGISPPATVSTWEKSAATAAAGIASQSTIGVSPPVASPVVCR